MCRGFIESVSFLFVLMVFIFCLSVVAGCEEEVFMSGFLCSLFGKVEAEDVPSGFEGFNGEKGTCIFIVSVEVT